MFYGTYSNIQAYPTPILYLKRGGDQPLFEDKSQLSVELEGADYFLVIVEGGTLTDSASLNTTVQDADYFLAVVEGSETDSAQLDVAVQDADYFLVIVDGVGSDDASLSVSLGDADYFLVIVEDNSPAQNGTLTTSLLSASYDTA